MVKGEFEESFEETPMLVAIFTMIGYSALFIIGHLRDFLTRVGILRNAEAKESPKLKVGACLRAVCAHDHKGFPPLYRDFESFYTRNLYRRIRDSWNRPICSYTSPLLCSRVRVAGARVMLKERQSSDGNCTFK